AVLRTAVVNWWATWPAPPTGGIVVSDRALLRLEHGGALDGEIAPSSLYPALEAQWPSIRARAANAAARAFTGGDADTIAILRRSGELDASIAGIAQALPSRPLDFFVVYLPGLDIAQNALLGPSAGTLTPSAMAARIAALGSYYPFLDSLLASLAEPVAGQTVLLVTQPGRVQAKTGGLFAVAPTMRARVDADGAMEYSPEQVGGPGTIFTVVDVAPTVWWALGLPLSRELSGKPAADLFGDVLPAPARYVPTYGRPYVTPAARSGKPLDQEMIDRLRSLGYIK
ncbi:MAG: hypothetical protein ACRD1V_06820, partial [Vicinamibacterales bacterium]